MAASQVFGIPELLENILLQLSLQAVADGDTANYILLQLSLQAAVNGHTANCTKFSSTSEKRNHGMEPIKALSRLNRVSRDFRAVIQGSPRLQRAMFAGEDTKASTLGGRITPLFWLLHCKLDIDVCPICINQTTIPLDHDRHVVVLRASGNGPGTPRGALKDFRASTGRFAEASWRQVKIDACNPDEKKNIHMPVYYRSPPGYRQGLYYFPTLRFRGSTTLEDVFQELSVILDRTSIEHAAEKEEERRQMLMGRTG